MEIFQGNHHCGLVIMYDFGNGYELAVFHSVAVSNLKSKSGYEYAYCMEDENAGPNITPLHTLGDWDSYGWPKINPDTAFFFDSKNRNYLWK